MMMKMKMIVPVVLLATLWGGVRAQNTVANKEKETSETLVLTLEQALEIALSENPTVKIADKTVEVKRYAKKGTYSALWPEISASATYQRYIKKQTMHFAGQSMEVGTKNNISAGFAAQLPLVNAQLW